MDWNYEGEYLVARIVSGVFIASIGIFAILVEYFLSPYAATTLISRFDAETLATLSAVFYGVTILMLAISFVLTANFRRPPTEGLMYRLLRAWTRNNHKKGIASAVGHLIGPAVALEIVALFGLVNFFFTAGLRGAVYPFLGIALVSMILIYPKDYEKENLIALDKAVQAEEAAS